MKTTMRFALLALLVTVAALPALADATIVIVNLDGPGEGFYDPTPAAPVGGNPGTTLGQQRLNAFAHAANIWAQTLDSNVTIYVNAAFNPLAPFGGYKKSGVGRELGRYGLMEFLETKAIQL